MNYELRFKTGHVCPLGEDPSLTDDQELALQSGAAHLVRIDQGGEVAVVLDVDDITEMSPRGSPLGPALTVSPDPNAVVPSHVVIALRSIRLTGADGFGAEQSFKTLADFDAAVRAARAKPQNSGQVVSCIITWQDEATFHGSILLSVDCEENLVDHVVRVCGDMVNDPERRTTAAAMLQRIVPAAMAESRLTTAEVSSRKAPSTSEPPTAGPEPAPGPPDICGR